MTNNSIVIIYSVTQAKVATESMYCTQGYIIVVVVVVFISAHEAIA